MDASLILDNLLTPPILFFLLGVVATLVKSDLEIPAQAARFLSLYLLFAIGLHGGHELAASEFDGQIILVLVVAMAASVVVPLWSFGILKLRLSTDDAAAIAATYGSVSAVTFITATGFLSSQGASFGGHMVAAMALMESPAIVTGILLARWFGKQNSVEPMSWKKVGHEAFFNGSVLLLLGSLLVGVVMGEKGWVTLKPVVYDPFKGVLCLFLLDMGLVAARRIRDMRDSGVFLVGFSIAAAFAHGILGIGLARAIGMPESDALLLAVLVGGASYIAVPAAVRLAIPRANPSLYVPMALGITFPFNVIFGIPLYHAIIQSLWSTPV